MRTRIFLTLMLLRTAALAAQDPQGGFVPVTEVPASEKESCVQTSCVRMERGGSA